ncbi:Mitochondrial Rho GTPase 1 [Camellia lanceoleosa]|uniref:Mitochondrial Rho GTPase 1 n=1 Tax=Camellia lanceoleosa TaxID=1840588 RepID=A0ACC0IFW1_9ERIC|nr:Mitochondrial Rho GTPase 1 [Camellia lanceoleosa]
MAGGGAAAKASSGVRGGVRIVVAGERGTGKSSLIVTAAADTFPTNAPPVLPPTRLPDDILENRGKLAEELKRADAVVLTYACDQPATLDRLSTFWLPELRRLEIPEVFYYAQKAVLHPTAPLFDQEAQTLKPRCVRALKRIFILCDHDRDGALSDAELNDFQVKCFNAPLQPSEIVGVKRVVQEKLPEGGRLETTWTVLRKFGYNNDIRLGEDLLPAPIKRAPDQSVELTSEAVEFLKGIFLLFDNDGDGALKPAELEDLFSTAPESPWDEGPCKDAAEKTALGGLSLDGFLSEWALMTLLDPIRSVENLIYIGYAGDPSSAIRVTRRRRLDRKKQQSERTVFQCFVFGPKKAGKSGLLNSFIGRPFSDIYTSTTDERYAVNVVDQPGVSQDMGIEAPIPLSTKLGDFNNVFRRIVSAAEHPHLSIPETEAGKSRKQYNRLINRSLMFVSVGAAVAIVGLAAYRVYAARKNASS